MINLIFISWKLKIFVSAACEEKKFPHHWSFWREKNNICDHSVGDGITQAQPRTLYKNICDLESEKITFRRSFALRRFGAAVMFSWKSQFSISCVVVLIVRVSVVAKYKNIFKRSFEIYQKNSSGISIKSKRKKSRKSRYFSRQIFSINFATFVLRNEKESFFFVCDSQNISSVNFFFGYF